MAYIGLGIFLACQAPQTFNNYAFANEIKTESIKGTEAKQKNLSIEEELAKTKEEVLVKRPYKLDPKNIKKIIVILVKPSTLICQIAPDWWSEKQAYDITKLYGLALAKYPGIKVQLTETWEDKIVREENLKNTDLTLEQGIRAIAARLDGDCQER